MIFNGINFDLSYFLNKCSVASSTQVYAILLKGVLTTISKNNKNSFLFSKEFLERKKESDFLKKITYNLEYEKQSTQV